MKTTEQTRPHQCRCQCCGTNTKINPDGDRFDRIPAGFRQQLNWTDGMRPFLGFYVFKG
jgi:hypothetical protein